MIPPAPGALVTVRIMQQHVHLCNRPAESLGQGIRIVTSVFSSEDVALVIQTFRSYRNSQVLLLTSLGTMGWCFVSTLRTIDP